jgi:hypothetical protein
VEVKVLNKVFSMALMVGLLALLIAPAFAQVGDISGDGKVDLQDLVLVAQAYGSSPGKTNWDPRCDLNSNGFVDLQDFVTVAVHFGEPKP